MTDKVQPGVKVDRQLWLRFREEVERRRGTVRGHLRTEVENALRDYIHGGDATPNEINQRLQRIESAVGVAATDGGADIISARPHTHAPSGRDVDEKPPANAPTDRKVAWLAQQIRDEEVPDGGELNQIPRSKLRDVVKDAYSFRSDTAKRYVGRLVAHFGLVDHPTADNILVTEAERARLLADREDDR